MFFTNARRAGAAILLCLAAGPAFAHAHLKTATPPVDGTVATAPTELNLTFSEGVNPRFSGVTLSGPDKAAITVGGAKTGTDDTTLVVPLAAPLAPGRYTVEWHALATDGHKTTGRYSFTIKP